MIQLSRKKVPSCSLLYVLMSLDFVMELPGLLTDKLQTVNEEEIHMGDALIKKVSKLI